MVYTDWIDNFTAVLNTALGGYSTTTTMGNTKRYGEIGDLAYAVDDVAKILIRFHDVHPQAESYHFGRVFIVEIVATTSENLENVAKKIEALMGSYVQAAVGDPHKIDGSAIFTEYHDGEKVYSYTYAMTAWWLF